MLDLKESEEGGVVYFTLTGTFDLYSAPDLDGKFDAWYQKGKKKIILDVKGLEHIDSSGLGSFLKIHTFLEERNGRVCVIGAHGVVARIFELTKIDQRMIVLADREQALRVLEKI